MKPCKIAVLSGAVLCAACSLAARPPELFIVNASFSLPRGIYRFSSRPPEPGDFIVIDSANVAFTPANTRFIKRIAYASGEYASLDSEGLTVNGEFYQKIRDIGVRFAGYLSDGECLILGDHPRSFDSRYFGPVKLANCRRVVPLLLIDGTS
jgi:type IV secretory pathway protease TraF